MSKTLTRAAEGALKSDAAFAKFLDRVNKELPQVDRICVSKVGDGKLRFVQVAQPTVLDYPLGREDRSFAADHSTLATYIQGGAATVNAELPDTGEDMIVMRRALGSSVHVPITIDGQPALSATGARKRTPSRRPLLTFSRR